MGKIKSAICLTLITLVIAVLCVTCFVPFPTGDGVHYYNPIINWVDKSADLGGYQFGGTEESDANYLGGSFAVVLYPDGVISAKEYRDNLADEGKTEEERAEYSEKYAAYSGGAIFIEQERLGEGGEPTEEFRTAFETMRTSLSERFERLHCADVTLEVADGYTFRASLPASMETSAASFLYYSYMGELTMSYGTSSDAASATQVLPEAGKKAKPITDYIESISSNSMSGTAYVRINFTDEGLGLISSASSDAANTAGYLFIQVGDNTVISLSVNEQIRDDLYVSGSYTGESANIVATTLDTAMKYGAEDLGLSMGELYSIKANFGEHSLDLIYLAYGICFVLMCAYFLIRYRRLGFAHILTYLIFLLAMVLCFWAVPIPLGVGTFTAFLFLSFVLAFGNAYAYECARKEYAIGKTIVSSVKTGYTKCFWHIFDLHIALFILGIITYFISLTELSAFALTITLGALFSGICTLVVNRFLWYIMMPFAKDAGKFCHFKREEVEEDDE